MGKNDKIKSKTDVGHRRNGFCLSNNPNLPWSLEFIQKHENRLNRLLYANRGIWEKVLKPILTEEKVKEIIKNND